jgi:DNA-directed RNA polymerase subunit M/transcription elongation factor TFIIS
MKFCKQCQNIMIMDFVDEFRFICQICGISVPATSKHMIIYEHTINKDICSLRNVSAIVKNPLNPYNEKVTCQQCKHIGAKWIRHSESMQKIYICPKCLSVWT